MTLRGLSPEKVKADRTPLGRLLETFVLAELLKLASWSDNRFEFFHYRDKEKNEVDIVIEDIQGRVVGVEVKAGATVRNEDFKGMKILADACGERFACGLVLYDDTKVLPFGEKMFAAPISAFYGTGPQVHDARSPSSRCTVP